MLNTGKTVAAIRAGQIEAQHLTLTFKCLSRGNRTHGARGRLSLYRDAELLFWSEDFSGCPDKDEAFSKEPQPTDGRLPPLTPWEVGAEYDGGPWDEHLPGMAVKPSNFLRAAFDDIHFYSAELTPAAVSELYSTQSVGSAAEELLFQYTFDSDDAETCRFRQLEKAGKRCFQINEKEDRIDLPALDRFPFINSAIGPDKRVMSPFQSPGAPIHYSLAEKTCAEVRLQGADADGDALEFHLVADDLADAGSVSLVSEGSTANSAIRFCDAVGGRRDVNVHFDACDTLGLCSSQFTGLGDLFAILFQS